jgi:hypothetical protein
VHVKPTSPKGASTVTDSAHLDSSSPEFGSTTTSRSVMGQRLAIALPNSTAPHIEAAAKSIS